MLLLLSITDSVAVCLPFPVHSSPLRKQSEVLEISLAWATGNMRCRRQIWIHSLLFPSTLSSAMIYWGRELEQPSNKSNNSVAALKKIRRQACPSTADSRPSNSAVVYGHTLFHSPRPNTASCSAAISLKFIIRCSLQMAYCLFPPHRSAGLRRPPRKRLAIQ